MPASCAKFGICVDNVHLEAAIRACVRQAEHQARRGSVSHAPIFK
jgi:hypothetical protein